MSKYVQILQGDKMGEVHQVIEEKQDRGKTFLILDDNSRMNASLINDFFIPVDGPEAGIIQRDDRIGSSNFDDPHVGLMELKDERHEALGSSQSNYSPSSDVPIPIGENIREVDVPEVSAAKQREVTAKDNAIDPRAEGLDDYESGKPVKTSAPAATKPNPTLAKKEEHPVIKMLNKAKKAKKLKDDNLDIVIKTLLPKASLVESLTDLYEDEGLEKIAEYIMESGDLKSSIIEAIKTKFNLETTEDES